MAKRIRTRGMMHGRVEYGHAGGQGDGRVLDLSLQGCRIKGAPPFCVGARLRLQLAAAECLGLEARPGEAALREIGDQWQPWRSVAACLFWQSYLDARGRTAPQLAPELYAVDG